MSTSFIVESTLRGLAARFGLRIALCPECDAAAPEADYQIIRDAPLVPRLNGPAGEMLFQGTMDRCSDFLRGWGSALKRAQARPEQQAAVATLAQFCLACGHATHSEPCAQASCYCGHAGHWTVEQ